MRRQLFVRRGPGQFGVGAFGWYLLVESVAVHRVRFSERNGGRRWRYVGPICWTLRDNRMLP